MTLTLGRLLLALSSITAAAEDTERLGIGGSITYLNPRTDELTRSPMTLRPLIRLQPGEGWGLAAALNWFETDVDGGFAGVNGKLGELQVRPLLVGAGYTLRHGRARTTFSLVAGPAWSRLKIGAEVRDAFAATARDIDDTLDVASFVVRPGVGFSYRIFPRADLTGFGGYMFNRPKFTVATPSGDVHNDWSADTLILSVGAVFVVF
jgi:hypothetical protein